MLKKRTLLRTPLLRHKVNCHVPSYYSNILYEFNRFSKKSHVADYSGGSGSDESDVETEPGLTLKRKVIISPLFVHLVTHAQVKGIILSHRKLTLKRKLRFYGWELDHRFFDRIDSFFVIERSKD